MSYNFLEAAQAIAESDRQVSEHAVADLRQQLMQLEFEMSCDGAAPLVKGEAGQAFPSVALSRIAMGRTRREGGGPVGEIEAWLQAEVVAAGVVAAHETRTDEVVPPEVEVDLREALTRFALSQC